MLLPRFSRTRSSRPEVFCKKDILKNCSHEEKKATLYRCFPVNFAKVLRAPFLRTRPVAASVEHILVDTFMNRTKSF